jgi:hypothetical protein
MYFFSLSTAEMGLITEMGEFAFIMVDGSRTISLHEDDLPAAGESIAPQLLSEVYYGQS